MLAAVAREREETRRSRRGLNWARVLARPELDEAGWQLFPD